MDLEFDFSDLTWIPAEELARSRPKKPYHRNNKWFPTEATDSQKTEWCMDNFLATLRHQSYTERIVLYASEETISNVSNWLIASNIIVNPPSIFLDRGNPMASFSVLLGYWLSEQAQQNRSYATSRFMQQWTKVQEKKMAVLDLIASTRARLISRIQQDNNYTGCIDCGNTSGPFEFDHRADKIAAVSNLLSHCQFDRAEEEAHKCDIRCKSCHLLKTMERRVEKQAAVTLTHQQEYARKRFLNGKKRHVGAKLRAGACAICNLKCDNSNVHHFEWDHIGEKQRDIAHMLLNSDKRFYAEIAKCRLLCKPCHWKHTNEQRASGLFTRKKAEMIKIRKK